MITCNFKAPNGEPSKLYQELEANYGADKASQIWNYTKSQQFKDKFEPELNEQGEPIAEWISRNISGLPTLQVKKKSIDPASFILHSGGALGSDTEWGNVAKEFGITQVNHYWYGNQTPNGNTEISKEQLEEGWQKVLQANKTLNRKPGAYKNLLSRNWFQVKNSDAVFAIVNGIDTKDNVLGGTGWAVQMAKDAGKAIYVFNQKDNIWYSWEGNNWKLLVEAPALTKQAGVIGTREITIAGKQAIRNVLENTFNDSSTRTKVPVESTQALRIADFGNGTSKAKMSYLDANQVISNFFQQARENPNKVFEATEFSREGLNKATSSGYTPVELANMFAMHPIPGNVVFSPGFTALIANTVPYISNELTPREVHQLVYSEDELQDILEDIRIPIRNQAGTRTGELFSAIQEKAGIDTIVSLVRMYYAADDKVTIKSLLGQDGTIRKNIEAFQKKFALNFELDSSITKEQAATWAANIQSVFNSWPAFVTKAIYKLEALGLKLTDRNALENIESLLESVETMTEDGKRMEDWADSSFELDPKDTASTRIKLFIGSIRDVTLGTEREPRRINLAFTRPVADRILGKDPIAGRKASTIRTEAQVPGAKVGGQYITIIDGTKFRVTVDHALTGEDLSANGPVQSIAKEEGITPVAGDLLLNLEEWKPKKDVVVPKENFLGFAELVDYDEVFQKLIEILHDQPNNLDSYLAELQEQGKNFQPVLLEVANKLSRESDQLQREFIKVMSKQYQEFNIMLWSKRRDGFMDMTPINANQGSAIQSMIAQWRENQKNAKILEKDELGNLVVSQGEATKLAERLEEIQVKYASETKPTIAELKEFAKDILEVNGIVIPAKALDYFFKHTERLTKSTSLAGGIEDQFKLNQAGQPTGVFSAIVMKLAGLTEEEHEDTALLNNNPLYTENTALKILARLAFRFSDKAATTSHSNSKGQSIYAYGMNSHLSKSVQSLITDPEYRNSLQQTHLGRRSWLLKQLINSSQARDNFGLQYVDGMKESYKKTSDGVQRREMSSREQLLYALGQFQHQKSALSNFLSLTHADKATTPLFTGIAKFDVGSGHTLPKETADAVWETFLGEYERVKSHYTTVIENESPTRDDSYNKGGKYYYFMPQFNYQALSNLVANGRLTENEMQLLWIDENTPNTKTNVVALKPLVLRVFYGEWLIPEINKMSEKMKAEGFLDGFVDRSYLEKNLDRIGVQKVQDHFLQDGVVITKLELLNQFLPWAAKDFILNYFLVHTALSSLIYGDPALTFKGKEGMSEKDAIQATMQEYQKRLAKDLAPGEDPTWDKPSYKSITLLDDERVHSYLDSLEKYHGAEINGTDAQEFTTVAEHLYVMKSLGLIKDSVYHEMMNIIEAGQKDNGYYEFSKLEHKAVIMQIMKPVAVSPDFVEVPGSMVVHYIKSSSMPLYPPMTAGFEIDKLRILMEKQGIDRANFISAKKMGAPAGRGLKIFDNQGNIDINDAEVSNNIQTLSRDGFRIQQDVPYDEFKDAILTGSQMNKLFTDDIDDKTFTMNGKEYSGTELRDRKEAVRKQLISMQVDEFKDKIGAEMVDGELRILDKNKLFSLLESEALARRYSPNDIDMIRHKVQAFDDAGGSYEELAIPLFFNPAADRFESLLMSLVKRVGQIYAPGKSYIQATSAGFKFKEKKTFESLSEENKNKIIWTPGYDGGEFTTLKPGEPAKVLIPFQFLIRNGEGTLVNANAEDYVTKDKDGRTIIDTNKIPESLLELIGFRIPTQKQNSMLPIRVAGFIPGNMGDAIIVPEAITKQMGSDFDVDKLYAYRRGYTHSDGKFTPNSNGTYEQLGADADEYGQLEARTKELLESNGQKANKNGRYPSPIFKQFLAKAVDEKYPDGNVPKHQVEGKPSKDGLMNEYFDIMWTVLTSPDMYSTVMQPLDTPDLKLEAQRALQTKELPNSFSPLTQLQDFESQQDADALRGVTSQFNTFYSWIQGKKLQAGHFELQEKDNWDEYTFDENNEAQDDLYQFIPSGFKFVEEGSKEVQHGYDLSNKASGSYHEELSDGKFVAHQRTRMDDSVTVQNATIDHAKERLIDKVNINKQTIYAAEAIISLASEEGKKATWKHAALFLRQPIILELVANLSRSGDTLSTTFEPDLMNKTIEKMIDSQMTLAGVSSKDSAAYLKQNEYDVLDVDKMKENLENPDINNFYLRQAGMLLAFGRLNEIGREMARIQRAFNQDPKGPGKNMIEAFDSITNRQRVLDSPTISGVHNLVNTEQGFIHKTELNLVEQTLQDILPYSAVRELIGSLQLLTGRNRFSAEVQRDIVKSFKSYIFSNAELGLSEDSNYDRFRLLYGNALMEPLATRVWKAQQDTKNYFLKRLQPQIATSPNTPSYVFYQSSKTSVLDDQENMSAFVDLLADPNTKDLAEDLIRYTYVTGGQAGSFTFLRHIPATFLNKLPFAPHLREVAQTLSNPETASEHSTFLEQWLRHNPQYARKIMPGMIAGKELPGEKFELESPDSKQHPTYSVVTPQGNGLLLYPKHLSYFNPETNRWEVFRQTEDGLRSYRRIDTLGDSYVDEYSYNSAYHRSIFTSNRAFIEPKDQVVSIDQTVSENSIVSSTMPVLQQLDIKEDKLDRTDSIILMADLAENDRVNPAVQVALQEVADVIAELHELPLSIEFTPQENQSYAGQLNADTNSIELIVGKDTGVNVLSRILLHEALHAVVNKFTWMPASQQQKFTKANKALQQIKEVQQEALQAVLDDALAKGITQQMMEKALLKGPEKSGYNIRVQAELYYAVSNVDEFISHIFEDVNIQKFLAGQTSKLTTNKSILSKIVEFFTNFIKALQESLGIAVAKNSLLYHGLARSMNLIQEIKRNPDIAASTGIVSVISNTFFNGENPSEGVWSVDNLAEAQRIAKEINNELPMIKAVFARSTEGFVVSVMYRSNYKIDLEPKGFREATNPIDRIYGKVQEQMRLIRASIAQNKKSPDVLRQNQLLAELRGLSNDIKATQDLEKVKELANYQIAWAQKVRDKFLKENKPTSINQIMTAYRLLSVWQDTLNMIYNNTANATSDLVYDEDFGKIQERAENLHNEFSSKIMWRAFKSIASSDITMEDRAQIEDIPVAEANFLDISRAKSKIVQEEALTIQNTHRQYLEEGQDLLKDIRSFEDDVKKLAANRGLKRQDIYKQLMQDGADWGLVTQYSPEFYKWKAGLRNRLSKEIEDFEKTIGDPELRSGAIKKAYDTYWRHLEQKAGFINVRAMFDEEGKKIASPGATKYRQEMVDEYGEEFTDKVLSEAEVKYKQYLDDREDIFDMYDTEVSEERMDAEEAEEAKAAWDLENSPIEKLSSRNLVTTSKYLNLGEKYLVLVPHKTALSFDGRAFFDKNFEKITNDAELHAIYNRVQEFMKSFKSNLPYYVESKLGDNFLAAIKKELIMSIATAPAYIKGIPEKMINMLTASSYEEFMQQQTEKEIPIMYTDNPFDLIPRPKPGAPKEAWEAFEKAKKDQLKKYTADLPRILELFGLMSLHYKNFSQARDAIELGEEVLKRIDDELRRGIRQVVGPSGKVSTVNASLKNTLGALAYTKDVLMFKRSQNLQGRLHEKTRKTDKTAKEGVKELREKIEDIEAKFANNEMTIPEYQDEMMKINNELKKYEARRYYGSKIGDTLITWTQLKSISYNPLSAINNLAFGLISATIHANGKQDYNWKDLRKAFSIMMNATGRSLGMARIAGKDSAMNQTAEKVLNIMDRMNVMGELLDTSHQNSNLSQKMRGARSTLQPYQMLRTGDYFVKSMIMVAMLHNQKVGDKTLWSMINTDGKYTDPTTQEQVPWEKIRNKIIGVNKIIMGNQDKSSPIFAKKNILYRLLGQFRLSWLSEGIASRFEGEKEDLQLGRTRKGRYRTLFDLGGFQSISILGKQLLSAIPGVNIDPFKRGKGKEISDLDKANMRRNLSEIGWFLGLYAIAFMLKHIASGDNDDQSKKWTMFWMNMGIRSYQDVALYSNPSVLDQIIGTPAPALGTIRDLQKFLVATARLMTDDDYTAAQWLRKLTRAGIVFPQTTLFNRFETMMSKDISTIQR